MQNLSSVLPDWDFWLHNLYSEFLPMWLRWNIGEGLYNAYIRANRRWSGARVGTAFLGDTTVKYLEWGRPQSPKLLILHGFGDSKDGVLPYAHALSHRFHVIAPDLPGFGESEKPARVAYTLEQFTLWMAKFADKVHFEQFVLAGHSLGGAIGVELALRMPQRVRRLILISAAGLVPTNDGDNIYERILAGKNPFEISSYHDFREFLQLIFTNPHRAPLPLKNYLFMQLAGKRTWFHKIFLDMLGDISSEESIAKRKAEQVKKFSSIRVPTLIVWGNRDGFFPESIGRWMHSLVPGSEYALIRGAAHMAPMEQAGRLAKLTLRFLAS
ncbi:MAG: alpha/beta hydrolase [Turneriella sp.]|nr:alpha/beta hydrolase [Turneriella sp.]